MFESFWDRLHSHKPKLIGLHYAKERPMSHYTTWPTYWFYKCKTCRSFCITGPNGSQISGFFPKCLDCIEDAGKIRYLKRHIPKADRG
jgi:hypothetical protein